MKIGVIIPVFNTEQYLRECLDSIKKQIFTDFIAVMINDCSTDHSKSICEEYVQSDERFILLNNVKNSGASVTRNSGLQFLKTKTDCNYVVFVDSDDYIDERYLSILSQVSESTNCKIVSSQYSRDAKMFINSDTITTTPCMFYGNRSCYKHYPANGPTCKLFHLSLFDNISFPPGKTHEDIWTIPKVILSNQDNIALVNAALYYYRPNPDSLCNKKYTTKKIDRIRGFQSCVDFCLENGYSCEQHFLCCMFSAINEQKIYLKNNRAIYSKEEFKEYQKALLAVQKELYNKYKNHWTSNKADKYNYLFNNNSFLCKLIYHSLVFADKLKRSERFI